MLAQNAPASPPYHQRRPHNVSQETLCDPQDSKEGDSLGSLGATIELGGAAVPQLLQYSTQHILTSRTRLTLRCTSRRGRAQG